MRQAVSFARTSSVVLLLCALCALAGCGGSGSAKTAEKVTACGKAAPGSASFHHVIWIWLENHDYDGVIGASSAPYMNSLAAGCGLATNYRNITHPSLPNYIAATSGLAGKQLNPFFSDCSPDGYCSTAARSIFSQVGSWRAYEESMPAPCTRTEDGRYAPKHNPPVYYRSLRGCAQRDLPLTPLARDLARNSLPAFSFITPNECNDAHSCPLRTADDWLANEVPRIVQSPAYRAGHTVLFVTFDESEGGSRVATVVVSPSTPAGRRSGKRFNHYSLLRTTEDLLQVPPLGRAKAASSMANSFGL